MLEAVSDLSRQRIATLYPGIRPLAYRILQDAITVFQTPMNVTDATRSLDEQFSIYKQGRQFVDGSWIVMEPDKIVTNSRGGLSFHNYGVAFDCAFSGPDPYLQKKPKDIQDKIWEQFGAIVKSHGLHWGGDFRLKNGARDKPHAEMAYGLQIHECLELYTQGGLTRVWSHFDEIRGVEIGQDYRMS